MLRHGLHKLALAAAIVHFDAVIMVPVAANDNVPAVHRQCIGEASLLFQTAVALGAVGGGIV